MATLINREAWHVGGCLSHGVIVKQDLNSNSVTINRGVAFGEIVVHSSQVILTIDKAIEKAEESVDYWQQKVKELVEEANRRELD